MKKIAVTLVLTALLATPAMAETRRHTGFVGLPSGAWHELAPESNTWHDNARWGQPPIPTGTYARSQDGSHYQRVDSYDVVSNGQIVGRDPDPNIRFQLLREADMPD
jgi:hypothetical protein